MERGNDVRRYDDPVEVRKGWVSGPGHVGEGPEQFLWRGRLWQVRAVLAHWVETGSWWQSTGARAVIGSEESEAEEAPRAVTPDLLAERELWRVEASRGPGRRWRGLRPLLRLGRRPLAARRLCGLKEATT